jgi:predicted metalloprotease
MQIPRAHRRPLYALLVLLLAAVALAACSSKDDGGPSREEMRTATRQAALTATAQAPSPTPTAIPSPTATPTPSDDPDGDGIVGSADLCPDEAESPVAGETMNWDDDTDGCPDSIEDLIALGTESIDTYWTEVFQESQLEYTPPSEIVPYVEPIETGCGQAVLNNAFYCPVSHGIYFDMNLMQANLDQIGDFGPVYILAHEWGHLVQNLLGRLDPNRLSVATELEADCLAGSYAAGAEAQGVLEEDDLSEAFQTALTVGDPFEVDQLDPQAHGTSGERYDAFNYGLQYGPQACLDQYENFSP